MLLVRIRRDVIRRWALALVLCAAPAAAYLSFAALERWRAQAHAREVVSALTRCLLGPSPPATGDGEQAARQLRAISIGSDLEERSSWPGRCETYLRSSTRALTALRRRAVDRCEGQCCANDKRCTATIAFRQELGRLRTYLSIANKSAFDADAFIGGARALDLLSYDTAGVPSPPRAARPLDHRTMRPLYQGDYLRLLTDPAGSESLRLLFYEQDRRYGMCQLNLQEPASAAQCGSLPDAIPVDLAGEMLASESGAPPRMYAHGRAGSEWVEALYDMNSGAEITRVTERPRGGFVWRDGTVAHLTDGPPMSLRRLRNGVPERAVPLVVSADAELSTGPRLIYDEIVWAERAPGHRHRILARKAQATEDPLGPLMDLGLTPPLTRSPSIEVCRTEHILALLVGANNDKGGVDAILLFRSPSGWQPATEVTIGTGRFGFTCRDDTATLSWIVGVEEVPDLTFIGEVESEANLPVRGRYSVHRLRCDAWHCKHDESTLTLERFSSSSRYVAGDAGDSMVVLWRSTLGDVRMKTAPLHRLADAPERSVFDDIEHDGFGWDLERDPIIGRSGNVLVLLSRQIGQTVESATYAFVVSEEGDVVPVAVATAAL